MDGGWQGKELCTVVLSLVLSVLRTHTVVPVSSGGAGMPTHMECRSHSTRGGNRGGGGGGIGVVQVGVKSDSKDDSLISEAVPASTSARPGLTLTSGLYLDYK